MKDIVARRLRNQRLLTSTLRQPADVVAWLGAVQSQEYALAKWALGLRSGFSDADVDRAFDAGHIVRTHILRPTWHFVAPGDIRWMQRLTGPRVARLSATYHRKLGLEPRDFARSRRVFERALGGGTHLTRAALGVELTRAKIVVDGQRLAHLVMQAELDLLICSGPRQGKQFTYALVDERVPSGTSLADHAGDEALAELARRYFQSHGPATVQDFVWWSGLTVGQAKTGLHALGRAVESEAVNGLTYWSVPGTPSRQKHVAPVVHLLPIYDEYLNALRDRSLAKDPSGPAVTVDDFVGFPSQLVIDGILRGAWRRTLTAKSVEIAVRPFRALSRKEKAALQAASTRYAAFMQLPATVAIV